jgi:hypothetical protein
VLDGRYKCCVKVCELSQVLIPPLVCVRRTQGASMQMSQWSAEIADLPGMRLEHLRDALIAAGQWPKVSARLCRLAAAPVAPLDLQNAAVEKFRRSHHLESSRALQQWLSLHHLEEGQLRDYFSRVDEPESMADGEVSAAWLRLEYGFGMDAASWRESLQKRRLAWLLSEGGEIPDWAELEAQWKKYQDESLKILDPIADWRLPPERIAELISKQRLRNAADERGWSL